jgi:hypothetical protein
VTHACPSLHRHPGLVMVAGDVHVRHSDHVVL